MKHVYRLLNLVLLVNVKLMQLHKSKLFAGTLGNIYSSRVIRPNGDHVVLVFAGSNRDTTETVKARV